MTRSFAGVGVSPGVAAGRVHLLHADALPVVPDPVPPERVDEEIARFERARSEARAEISALKERVQTALGDSYAGILEAQLLILEDDGLVSKTVSRIRVGRVSARWALKEVVGEFVRQFDGMKDAYLRERGGDLGDVHRRLQRLLRGDRGVHGKIPEGAVIVAHTLAPSDAVVLAGKGVAGLVTDVGGRTSHTAILAQALGVPAVAGLHDISQRVRAGDQIIIDGDSGAVQWLPSAGEIARAQERWKAGVAEEQEAIALGEGGVDVTKDGVEVTLRANIEFPGDAATAKRFGARGIGLYRSEFLFVTRSPELPTEEEHYQAYREIGQQVAPFRAVIRTLDLGGEKYFHEVLDREGANPVLGLRGVRLCLARPDVFRPQLRGLLRAAVDTHLQVMLPLVTTLDEIRQVRQLLAEEAEQLQREGQSVRADVPLGVMIEVPGAAAAADILAREADFFSLGTNDLIQYALAADRANEAVSYLYQPLHPGVLRMLRFVIDSARRQGITVTLCGEMATDAAAVGLLIGFGLREVSVQPRALPAVRKIVRAIDCSEAARLAAQAVECGTAAEVERKVREARAAGLFQVEI